MVFSDLFFLFVFMPLFTLLYVVCGRSLRAKNWVLVAFSLIFYAWGEPVYVFLMLVMVLINYIAGRIIDGSHEHRRRKRSLVAGVACNVLALGIFKYASLTVATLNLTSLFHLPDPHIALPIGISFYTFQSISYLIDVYKRQSPCQRRFVDLLLYISMFPQLIAGPIVRYGTVAEEINNRHASADDIADGLFRFVCGLGKKVILANQMSLIAEQFLVDGFDQCTTSGAWLGILAYSMQVYFDFSGYSDMAIGIGRCLGFHFNENFTHPYCCTSITDFWHRWHKSLGSFFRDYVYIPLGGNRRHQWFNILATWFLTGFWHGASWNFACWGLYFGVILIIEKYTLMRKIADPVNNATHGNPKLQRKVIDLVPRPLLHVYALSIVLLGRGLFYFTDWKQMFEFFHKAFGGAAVMHNFQTVAAVFDNFWLWIICIIFCMPARHWVYERICAWRGPETATNRNLVLATRLAVSLLLIVLSVTLLIGETNNPFIYTRF